MCHRDYFYDVSRNTVVNAKRKSGEDNPTCSVDRQRPSFWSLKYSLDNEIKFQQKGLSRHRATLGIPHAADPRTSFSASGWNLSSTFI
jgi:hypothetical protein